MSARNFCLSLTSPSHSVFTNRPETRASSAAESRLTWASFHSRSRTVSLLSRGSACWAAKPLAQRAKNKQKEILRTMGLHVRRHPNVQANVSADDISANRRLATEILFR